MSSLNLILLGPPYIERDGAPVKLDTKKTLALLVYLSLTRSTHRRDSLADLLWPHSDGSNGRSLLRGCLHNINKVLGDRLLDSDRETLTLNPDADLQVDVDEFRKYLSECGTHGHSSTEICHQCVKPLTEAVSLYRGDFLAGFNLQDSLNFDDWQFSQTENLRSEMISGLERLVRFHSEEGEFEKAIGHTQRWLELDRRDEKVHRYLMEFYARTGRHAAALRQYEVLGKEIGSPGEETTRLYQEIKENVSPTEREVVSESSPPKAPDTPNNNLPIQLTSFIGRKWEMGEVKGLLTTTSLLTLTGSGGSGKTRLALEELYKRTKGSDEKLIECTLNQIIFYFSQVHEERHVDTVSQLKDTIEEYDLPNRPPV